MPLLASRRRARRDVYVSLSAFDSGEPCVSLWIGGGYSDAMLSAAEAKQLAAALIAVAPPLP